VLALSFVLGYWVASHHEVPAAQNVLATNQKKVTGTYGRAYYCSKNTFQGNSVLTACSTGFHTASMIEINDAGTLQYDSTLGFANPDSGSGPPLVFMPGTAPATAAIAGWIRTGGDLYSSGAPLNNCKGWTSNIETDRGVAVYLTLRDIGGGANLPLTLGFAWRYIDQREQIATYNGFLGCNQAAHVWCVQD
jgi:hypothetical protein